MTTHRVSVKRRIGAPALVTYAVIADYADGHPQIVPPKVFRNLIVESGGVGEGTTIRFDMRVLGIVRHVRAIVAEPSPGRVLTEQDIETGTLTTFLVKATHEGRTCDVTITTDLKLPGGPLAGFQAKLVIWFLRRVYTEELGRLEAEARRRDATSRGPAAAPSA
jgi:hypothetical protein